MSQKVLKFGSQENIKFIEMYRNYDCLWNPQNPNYKNRDSRDAALKLFTTELGIENFGPKKIMTKIKNMRSQYLQESKKVKSSIGTGAGTSDIYTPKLPCFMLLGSFLKRATESRPTFTNLPGQERGKKENILDNATQDDNNSTLNDNTQNNNNTLNNSTQEYNNTFDGTIENNKNSENNTSVDGTQEFNAPRVTQELSRRKRKNNKDSNEYIISALDKLENIEKRAKASTEDDDLAAFGKYVTLSLRKLNTRNCLLATDEIQTILSKYKLRQFIDSEVHSSASSSVSHTAATPMPESPFSHTEENLWWPGNDIEHL